MAYLVIAATANALYDRPSDKHVIIKIKYMAFAESCTKNNNAAIINPKVPTSVKIQILVICGLIKFQSSLLPRNFEVLTKEPINMPTAINDVRMIPGVPVKNDVNLEPVEPPVPELVAAVVRFALLLGVDDILPLTTFYYFAEPDAIIFLTAFAGNFNGAVPKNTTIKAIAINNIWPPTIKIRFDLEKSNVCCVPPGPNEVISYPSSIFYYVGNN